MKKSYAVAGSWGFGPDPKGVSTFAYSTNSGALSYIDTVEDEVCASQLCMDEEKQVIYFVDSRENLKEKKCGGSVWAFKINPADGKLILLNRKETMCPVPDYLCLDKSKKYLLVAHYASHQQVTQIARKEDGTYESKVYYDDAAIVLFRVKEDGSIGDICDISVPAEKLGLRNQCSHLDYIMQSPKGNLFLVCDKGLDRIYTYRLDEKEGKLIFLQAAEDSAGSSPRYALFHPALPLVYVNHERNAELDTYQYNEETGELCKRETNSLLLDWYTCIGEKQIGASDLVFHPNGKYIYAGIQGIDIVSFLELDSYGGITLKQNIDCGGKSPRGLCVSPDGSYLFVLNGESQTINTFLIEEDGRLLNTSQGVHANMSACMKILAS